MRLQGFATFVARPLAALKQRQVARCHSKASAVQAVEQLLLTNLAVDFCDKRHGRCLKEWGYNMV